MRNLTVFLSFIFSLQCAGLQAQEKINTKQWFFEAGPYVGIPAWSFSATRSVGFGVNARIARDLGNNFSGGGAIALGHFLGKKAGGFKFDGFTMAGIYADLQYTYLEKYVAGGNIGLGLGFSGNNSIAGFARTGYLGYQFRANDHLLTLAAYLNRTTLATYNIGIKSWFRF